MITGIVLAAGGSSRFGSPKQVHRVRGRPMLEWPLAALAAAPVDERLVVLGAHADAIAGTVALHGARPVMCAGWAGGQAASLRAGLAAADDRATAALVLLGDGPDVSSEAIARVLGEARRRPGEALRAGYGGGLGHPVVLPRAVWAGLPRAGDAPGRGVRFETVDCRDLSEPGDVDYST